MVSTKLFLNSPNYSLMHPNLLVKQKKYILREIEHLNCQNVSKRLHKTPRNNDMHFLQMFMFLFNSSFRLLCTLFEDNS